MSLCSASVCGFFYSRCHFTKQKLGLTHGPDSRFMCCCNTLQTAVKLLFHFCFCFVAHGSEWCFHSPLSFGQLFFLFYFIFFGGGFGLASAPASPPSPLSRKQFSQRTASQHLNSSADAYVNVQALPPKSAGSRLCFPAHWGRSRHRLVRGNESELALKNKNYKSIKKFLNYLSVILQAFFFSLRL